MTKDEMKCRISMALKDPVLQQGFEIICKNLSKLEKEWHYVKNELPISDKDKFYFIVDKWNLPMIARFYKGVWSNATEIDDVIA